MCISLASNGIKSVGKWRLRYSTSTRSFKKNSSQCQNVSLNMKHIFCAVSCASLIYMSVKGECSVFKKKLLWMKTMHYPNTIRSNLITIVTKAPFTPKSTSKLRSALHIRYSIIIPRFISGSNTAQSK